MLTLGWSLMQWKPMASMGRTLIARPADWRAAWAGAVEPRCRLCGGNAGDPRQFANGGAHNLCIARAANGLPTPSLGMRCKACNGHGRIPRSRVGPINPSQRAMDEWAPKCVACGGKGAL